jgi:hypothetical protein
MRPTTQAQTNQQFRDSILRDASQSERLALSFEGYRTIFLEAINQLLTDFGLAQKLEAAKQKGQKLRILQLNCSEGLYLHELARVLEERGLLEGADLYGITEDLAQISTAEVYSKISKPPRPYLNFYQHNLHQPLTECLGLHEDLKMSGAVQFDFIFGLNESLSLLKEAKTVLARLYQDNVKPDGLLYFIETILREGAEGWIAPHPAIAKLNKAGILVVVRSYNPGVEVALDMVDWLREQGASPCMEFKAKTAFGGETEQGRAFLRSILLAYKIMGPQLVKAGLLEQGLYDQLMQELYQGLTPQHTGQLTFNRVIARKP